MNKEMDAAAVLRYANSKWPKAMNSPVAVACREVTNASLLEQALGTGPFPVICEPHRLVSCGCCTGNGTGANMPGNDQCTCWMHQDSPRGRPPHVCAHHERVASEFTDHMEAQS